VEWEIMHCRHLEAGALGIHHHQYVALMTIAFSQGAVHCRESVALSSQPPTGSEVKDAINNASAPSLGK